jgi:diadenosine tetraphosphate (Ap4A) HIT family hydrolase
VEALVATDRNVSVIKKKRGEEMDKCTFCEQEIVMKEVPFAQSNNLCERWIYESQYCYAVLKPEQHTIGESIVILKEHRVDITNDIPIEELSDFMKTINIVASRIKRVAKNNDSKNPERIYVGILCDGTQIQHLHAHLIPRYPFNEYDKSKYKEFFLKRDGKEEILRKQNEEDLGGYWYVFDKEQTVNELPYGKLKEKDKVACLEALARELRSVK